MFRFRIITGLSLFAIFMWVTMSSHPWNPVLFCIILLFFGVIGFHEAHTLLLRPPFPKSYLIMIFFLVGGLIYLTSTGIIWKPEFENNIELWWKFQTQGINLALILSVILFLIIGIESILSKDQHLALQQLISSLFIWAWILPSFITMLLIYFYPGKTPYQIPLGPFLVSLMVILVKAGDIGGYTFGYLSKKIMGSNHKLIPHLSPGKSWEGFLGTCLFPPILGSLLLSLGGGWLLLPSQRTIGYETIIIVGIIIAPLSLVGDLIESLIKRVANQKDAGNLLPGMGGVLDFLDSLCSTLPLLYILAAILVL